MPPMNITRLRIIFFASFLAFCFISFTIPYHFNEPTEISIVNMENDILNYVNLHRKSLQLKPLQLNAIESTVAGTHSSNMASGKTPFGHAGMQKRINIISRQLGFISSSGENVAFGQMNAKEVVNTWLASPGHRRNIEGDYILTGIGVAKDKKGNVYYTEIFTR
jgi:uncharacterized protein YkwD